MRRDAVPVGEAECDRLVERVDGEEQEEEERREDERHPEQPVAAPAAAAAAVKPPRAVWPGGCPHGEHFIPPSGGGNATAASRPGGARGRSSAPPRPAGAPRRCA